MGRRSYLVLVPILAVEAAALLSASACSGGSGSAAAPIPTSAASTTPATTTIAAAYGAASWSSAVTVSFPSSCTMTYATTGVPDPHADYYLAPVSTEYPTVVAETPITYTLRAWLERASEQSGGQSAKLRHRLAGRDVRSAA